MVKRKAWVISGCLLLLAVVLGGALLLSHASFPVQGASAGDWSTFMNTASRTGTDLNETTITAQTASSLHLAWKYYTNGPIEASPITANGVLYIGSYDGYEYAL